MSDPAVTAGVVALCMALVETVKALAAKLGDKGKDKGCGGAFGEGDRMKLQKILELHSMVDQNGVPMHLVPRSWVRQQEKTQEIHRMQAETQRKILDVLERSDRRLEGLERSGSGES